MNVTITKPHHCPACTSQACCPGSVRFDSYTPLIGTCNYCATDQELSRSGKVVYHGLAAVPCIGSGSTPRSINIPTI